MRTAFWFEAVVVLAHAALLLCGAGMPVSPAAEAAEEAAGQIVWNSWGRQS